MRKKMMVCMLIVLLTGGVLWPACAQAAERVKKAERPLVIAILLYSENNLPLLAGFKAGLRERGYIEGQDVEYVFNGVVEGGGELDAAMALLAARKPDLVYAAPFVAAQAAQRLCRERSIPLLFGPANNVVQGKLVRDLKHPGENATGVMLADSEAKRLQWSVEIAPQIRNVLVPYNPEDTSALASLETARQGAAGLGLKLLARTVRNQAEIDALIAQWPEGVDSVYLPRDGMVMSRIKDFAELAIRKKMVLSTGTRVSYVEQGALFSYGFDDKEITRQVARLADQILKGKKPGDLPVETAEDYLAVNLRTAKAIGLVVDKRILGLAHRVIRPE